MSKATAEGEARFVSLFDLTARSIDGREVALSQYRGQVCLVVNTASECGFTSQYDGLEKLYATYRDRGFTVLGFPCNQFRGQEPGTDEEIADFCSTTFQLTFPMFSKIDVNGPDAHPVFSWLTAQKGGVLGGRIAWNFTKFLVGRDGEVIRRFAPPIPPHRIARAIERALDAS